MISRSFRARLVFAGAALLFGDSGAMAENRIDVQRPDAPDLAAYGAAPVGVRTIELVNNDQIDIVAIDPKAPKPDPLPRYDRALTVEVWYPAAEGVTGETAFPAMIRDGKTIVTLHGRAMRDVAPGEGKWPLVIVSHGYPGNRYLLSHLAENIASKGYVVASIDHRDSTYDDKTAFGSTLVNRPLDQIFVLSEMARLGGDGESFLNGIVDSENSALIGYSMGVRRGHRGRRRRHAGLGRLSVGGRTGRWAYIFLARRRMTRSLIRASRPPSPSRRGA